MKKILQYSISIPIGVVSSILLPAYFKKIFQFFIPFEGIVEFLDDIILTDFVAKLFMTNRNYLNGLKTYLENLRDDHEMELHFKYQMSPELRAKFSNTADVTFDVDEDMACTLF